MGSAKASIAAPSLPNASIEAPVETVAKSTSLPDASIEAPVETTAKNTSLPNMTWSLSAEVARQCQKQWQEPSQGGGYGPSWGPPKPSGWCSRFDGMGLYPSDCKKAYGGGWYQWVCNSHGRTIFCSSDCRNCN